MDSEFYKKELKKYKKISKQANDKYKKSKQPNDKEMSLFYEKKVKEYSDLYIKKKQLEQKGLEQEKLEKQLDTLEKESQIKDKEQERLEKERLEKERLEKEELEEKEMLEQEMLEQEILGRQRKLKKERLNQQRLEQERLEKERLEQERLDMLKKESQIKDDEQERLNQERLNQERLEQKRLDKIKYKQQRKNLKRREESYEERTEEKYHPLVTDNEDKNDNILIPQDNAPPTTLNSLPTSTQQIPLPIVSPPKLVPTNKKTRKKIKTPKTPPVYEGIEMTDFNKPKISVKNKTRKIQNLGFTETLRQPNANNQQNPKPLPNSTICQNIFINGSKTNNKYFYPSEFPKLTKIKPITVLTKKGGKNYKRKTFKKKYKNKNKY